MESRGFQTYFRETKSIIKRQNKRRKRWNMRAEFSAYSRADEGNGREVSVHLVVASFRSLQCFRVRKKHVYACSYAAAAAAAGSIVIVSLVTAALRSSGAPLCTATTEISTITSRKMKRSSLSCTSGCFAFLCQLHFLSFACLTCFVFPLCSSVHDPSGLLFLLRRAVPAVPAARLHLVLWHFLIH